jgi:peptidoglycan/xylan/chitin deacetylase (PgdA/CDA1 family)
VAFETSRIPFADRKGLNVWPNGARMAALVYTAAEQWTWQESETLKPVGTFAAGRGAPVTLSSQSAVSYGYTVGLPRMRQIFRDFGMSVTVWTSGVAAEQCPDIVAALAGDGHEIGAHGYSQGRVMASMSRPAQEEAIGKSAERLERVSGRRPTGWVSPGAECNEDTVELLAAAGFDYHGDLQDDELPYFLHVAGSTLVEIPYRLVGNLNDLSILTRNVNSVSGGLKVVTDAFDAYYRAAGDRPLVFNYGTHPYVSGRPDNALILRGLLEHIHGYDDVWVTNYGEIARWWRQSFAGKVAAGRGVIDVHRAEGRTSDNR